MGGGWLEHALEARFPLDEDLETWLAIGSESAYETMLGRWYGFTLPLEAAFATTDGLGALLDLDQRAKARLLARDLATLGVNVATLPVCPEIPPFGDPLVALGWLLAVERPTLWHELILVQLGGAIPGSTAFACTYLRCYGAHAAARWTQLLRVIASLTATDDEQQRAIEAASAGLACLRRWTTP